MIEITRILLLLNLLVFTLSLPVVEILSDDEREASDKEQRELDFPNTSVIPGDLTEELGVDYFFSLWTVLQDEDISTSDEPFTILAPTNLAKRPSSFILGNPERLKKLILSHILLGRKILSNDIISSNSSIEERSLGGTSLQFVHTTSGVLVNNRRVLRSDVFVPQGTIIILEDYLVENQDDVIENRIPMIELGTKDESDVGSWKLEEIDLDFGRRVFEAMSNESKPFYEELIDVLSLLKSGTSEFRRYFLQADVSKYFIDDGEYTAFIPMDDAFQKWYPIDWGFNPFEVQEFVRVTILNHIVVGKVKQSSAKDGGILTTLGGKQIIIKRSSNKALSLNGVSVFDGDTPTSHGNVWFVRDILFVDSAVVRSLQIVHKDKETAPLVTFPWYNSQFLSHVFTELEGRNEFNLLVDYLNGTNEFADDLPSHDENFSMIRYSFFAPTDDAINRTLSKDVIDDLKSSEVLRKQFLMDHTVSGRLYSTDFVDGAEIEMISGKKVLVSKVYDTLYLNQVRVTDEDIFIYNLGNMFILDGALFTPAVENEETTTTNAPAEMEKVTSRTENQFQKQLERPTYLSDILAALSHKGNNYRSLRRYLEKATDLDSDLVKIGDFTLIAPTNGGFSRWTPADAADPFYVGQAARRNMFLDHIIKGHVAEKDLKDGATLETLSGKKIPITIANGKINIGDKAVLEERIEISTGTILFTDSMVFVNFEDINQALSEFHNKFDKGPLIMKKPISHNAPEPHVPNINSNLFKNSPFLEKTYSSLQNKEDYHIFRNYLENTLDLDDEIGENDTDGSFTMIIPDNWGITRWLLQDTADPYFVSKWLRKKMLKDHIIKGKLQKEDFVEGAELITISGKKIPVTIKEGAIILAGKATVTTMEGLSDPIAPYVNTDSMVFVDYNEMSKALNEHHEKNGYVSPFHREPIQGFVPDAVVAMKPFNVSQNSAEPFENSSLINSVLTILKNKTEYSDFANYLEWTPELEDELKKQGVRELTLIVPKNDGIKRWTPPESVDAYHGSNVARKNMILDHIIKGVLEPKDLKHLMILGTASRKCHLITKENGVVMIGDKATIIGEEDTEIPGAKIIYTDSLITINDDDIDQSVAGNEPKYVKAPVFTEKSISRIARKPGVANVTSKLFRNSPFLEKTYSSLQDKEDYHIFRNYLENTVDLDDEIRKDDTDGSFTMIIPDNWGITRWLLQDTADPYFVSKWLRKKMLKDHIVKGKLQKKDFVEGAELITITGKKIPVSINEDAILLADRAVVTSLEGLSDPVAPYVNTDSMVFVDFNEMYKALDEYHEKSPPQSPWGRAISNEGDSLERIPEGNQHPLIESIRSFLMSRLSTNDTDDSDDLSSYQEYFLDSGNLSEALRKSAGYSDNVKKYTVFVPTTQGIRQWIPRDTQDVYRVDPSFRQDMIIDHIVPRFIEQKDLSVGSTFETVNGRKIEVAKEGGGLNAMGDIISGPYSLGNEGHLYIVDNILFFHFDRIQKILDQNP